MIPCWIQQKFDIWLRLALLCLPLLSIGQREVYVHTSDGNLYEYNLDVCAPLLIGNLGTNYQGLALSNDPQYLYAVTGDQLFRVDVTDASSVTLGTLSTPGFSGALDLRSLYMLDSGELVGVNSRMPGEVFTINVNTLVATYRGDSGADWVASVQQIDGEIYVASYKNWQPSPPLPAPDTDLIRVQLNPFSANVVADITGLLNNTIVDALYPFRDADPCLTNAGENLGYLTESNFFNQIDHTNGGALSSTACSFSNMVTVIAMCEVPLEEACTFDLLVEYDAYDEDKIFCEGDPIQFNAILDPPTPVGIYTYAWREEGQATVLSTGPTLNVLASTSTTYVCDVVDTGQAPAYSMNSDSIDVTVVPSPVIDFIPDISGYGSIVLPTITGINLLQITRYTQPAVSFSSYLPGSTITSADLDTNPATFTAIADNGSGCIDEVQFEINLQEFFVNIDATSTELCPGESVVLNAMVVPASPLGTYQYEWVVANTGVVLGQNPSLVFAPQSTTQVMLSVTDTGAPTGTLPAQDDVVITVSDNPTFTLPTSIDAFDTYTLPAVATTAATDVITFTDLSTNTNLAAGTLLVSEAGTNTYNLRVNATSDQGCSASQELIVTVTSSLTDDLFPRFFTPNGDGFHDRWKPNSETFEVESLFIFDRFGKLLKQSDPRIGWDGTYNGNPMPSTSYWYKATIRIGERRLKLSGYFALRR